MNVLPNENGPMLGRIRISADVLGDHLPYPRFISQPFPAHACDRMPAYLDNAKVSIHPGLAGRYHVWFRAEPEGMLECELSFDQPVFALLYMPNWERLLRCSGSDGSAMLLDGNMERTMSRGDAKVSNGKRTPEARKGIQGTPDGAP